MRIAIICVTALSLSATSALAAPFLVSTPRFLAAVSADGTYVAGSLGEAFRWSLAGGVEPLPSVPAGTPSSAGGISADGQTVVGSRVVSASGTMVREAFRWSPAGAPGPLGILPGKPQSAARAVSADGSTVVGKSGDLFFMADASGIQPQAAPDEAFRWTSAGGLEALGTLPGFVRSDAIDVSDDGTIIFGNVTDNGPSFTESEGFVWTESSKMVGMGNFPSETFSRVLAASGDGSVVWGTDAGRAFRWTSAGGWVLWGTSTAFLFDASDGGVFVGSVTPQNPPDPFTDETAAIWDPVHGTRELLPLLAALGVDTNGWYLERAEAISADGRTLVGEGIDPNGEIVGWVAFLPEPATGLLAAVAVLATMARSRGRRR